MGNMSMMGRSSWLVEQYRGIMEEKADPRVADWMLMSSPLATVILCLTYLLIVRVLGPLFMANREPYDLKYPMLAYNLFQTLFNGWIFLGGATSQSLLTSLTRSSSSFARSLTTCLRCMLFTTAPCPSSPGLVPSMLGAVTLPLEGCGTHWSTCACTPTTSCRLVDLRFRNIFGGRDTSPPCRWSSL